MTSYIKCAAVDIIRKVSAPRSLPLIVLTITTALIISSTHQQGVASEDGEVEAVDLPVDGDTGTEIKPPPVNTTMVQTTSNSTVDANATTSAANGTTATSESHPASSTNATTVVNVPIADDSEEGGVGWVAGGLIIAGVVVALAALGACVVYRVRRKRGGGSLV